jgi:hypothetical protein
LKRVLAYGAYDNNETFRYLSDKKNIEAAIKARKNSPHDSRSIGCYSRKRDIMKQLKNSEGQKAKVSYGSRLMAE